jgi:hypothetical protein
MPHNAPQNTRPMNTAAEFIFAAAPLQPRRHQRADQRGKQNQKGRHAQGRTDRFVGQEKENVRVPLAVSAGAIALGVFLLVVGRK